VRLLLILDETEDGSVSQRALDGAGAGAVYSTVDLYPHEALDRTWMNTLGQQLALAIFRRKLHEDKTG
jgi:hypothetical protein